MYVSEDVAVNQNKCKILHPTYADIANLKYKPFIDTVKSVLPKAV